MNQIPRQCTRSEKKSLPTRRCPHCNRRVSATWVETVDMEARPLDPIGVVSYSCPDKLCDGESGF